MVKRFTGDAYVGAGDWNWGWNLGFETTRWSKKLLVFAVVCVILIVAAKGQGEGEYPSGGLNFEPCRSTENCKETKSCITSDSSRELSQCSESKKNCICIGIQSINCEASNDCQPGERCTENSENNETKLCATCRFPETDELTFVDENPATCEGAWPGGYTLESCNDFAPCQGSRSCSQFVEDDGDVEGETQKCLREKKLCYCMPQELIKCSSSSECDEGDQCVRSSSNPEMDTICVSCGRVAIDPAFEGIDSPTSSLCLSFTGTTSSASSPTPSSTPDPSTSPSGPDQSNAPLVSAVPPTPRPCIATTHLVHMRREDLVFAAHRRASVLCDASGSCATAGHIVTFHGRAMSMGTYCSIATASCSTRVAFVNSPRMRRALKLPSFTPGLHFTAFSARYEHPLEEAFLRALIFFGF